MGRCASQRIATGRAPRHCCSWKAAASRLDKEVVGRSNRAFPWVVVGRNETTESRRMSIRVPAGAGSGSVPLAPLTDADLRALFAWFQSIKPIENQVPQPSPPK